MEGDPLLGIIHGGVLDLAWERGESYGGEGMEFSRWLGFCCFACCALVPFFATSYGYGDG